MSSLTSTVAGAVSRLLGATLPITEREPEPAGMRPYQSPAPAPAPGPGSPPTASVDTEAAVGEGAFEDS